MGTTPRALSPALQALLDKSAALKAEAARLMEQARNIDREIIEEYCDFGPGDIVTVTAYSHHGKTIEVDSVRLKWIKGFRGAPEEPVYLMEGRVLGKFGYPTKNRAKTVYNIDMTPREGGLL